MAAPCPLSSAFSKLPALTDLSISYPVNGTLPQEWSALTKLTTISLKSTNLVGSIPATWSGMSALASLTIQFNASNTATATEAPAWMAQLKTLVLTNVAWTAFPSTLVDSASLLTQISLSNANIQSAFPLELATNTKLKTLEITNTSDFALSPFGNGAALPYDISGMTSLQHFTVTGASFAGVMPVGYPSSLLTLTLGSLPNLIGSISIAVFELPNLYSFSLSRMPLMSGGIRAPTNIAASKLSTVSITDSGLDGTIAADFGSLPRLTVLTLTNLKGLTGGFTGPVGTTDLPCNYISVSITGLSSLGGSVPASFFSVCPFLSTINLDNNGFTGALPATLAASVNNTALYSLSISNNPTSGTIPNIHFASTTEQLQLSLFNAGLTGSIPLSLLNTSGIGYNTFLLYGNSLSLCDNANASAQTGFAQSGLYQIRPSCNLEFQLPTECGCPSSWPTACFPDRAMPANCSAIPPSYEPGTPYTPSAPSSTPSSTPSAPPSSPSTPSSVPSATPSATPTTDDGPTPSSASFLTASFVLAAALCTLVIGM